MKRLDLTTNALDTSNPFVYKGETRKWVVSTLQIALQTTTLIKFA